MSGRPPFYKPNEAARFLKVSPQKLRGLVATGDLPPPTTIGDEHRSFGIGLKQTTGWPLTVLIEYKKRNEVNA